MGENVSQASLKITKQNHKTKRQLNSLIRVLRPKVYITDTSNFKHLVQQLTGKMHFPSPQTRSVAETELENVNVPVIDYTVPVIDYTVDDEGDRRCQSRTEAFPLDAYVDSFEFSNNLLSSFTEGFREADNQVNLNDATFDMLSTNQAGVDWLAYQDLESWLLDIDHQPYPSFNGYEQTQEVSIYDYELSGLV